MQNINYRNAYTANGSFNKELFFLEVTKVIPNMATFEFESGQYDIKQITNELLFDLFPDNKFIRMSSDFSFVKTSCVPKLADELYVGGEWMGMGITVLCTDILWGIHPESIVVYYHPKYSITEIRNKCDELVKRLPKADKTPKAAEVKLVAYDRDYYTINSSVKKVELDIDSLYNDDFKPVHEDIVKFISERNSGLIVMRGKKGTGNWNKFLRILVS